MSVPTAAVAPGGRYQSRHSLSYGCRILIARGKYPASPIDLMREGGREMKRQR